MSNRTPASLDPRTDRLGEILAHRGIDPDRLARDEHEPGEPMFLIRRALIRCAEEIPRHYRSAVPDMPEVRAWVDALVAGAVRERITPRVVHGPSLFLVGPTGTGKTYQAFAAMRDLSATGVYARWVAASAADLYANLRPRYGVDSETEFRRYATADVLVVDDLGAAKATEWTEEINYRLINQRYEDERPTLFTSNVPPSRLPEVLGERVASRLGEMCNLIPLKGGDRRRKDAA